MEQKPKSINQKKISSSVFNRRRSQDNTQIQNLNLIWTTTDALKHIFQYLTFLDLVIYTRVSKSWKLLIENDPKSFQNLNFGKLTKRITVKNATKFFTKGIQIKTLELPITSPQTDIISVLYVLPKYIQQLTLQNLNIEFANVFHSLTVPSLEYLELVNLGKRKKLFDENEIKAIYRSCQNIKQLVLVNVPIDNQRLILLSYYFQDLHTLTILQCPYLDNSVLSSIAKHCLNIKKLEIGALPGEYNMNISIQGLESFKGIESKLEIIRFEYCARIGDECIILLQQICKENLRELHIIRNCYEKCAKITDISSQYFKYTPNIQKLSIVYSRKLREIYHLNISRYLRNLRVLNLRECPIQEDLSCIINGCPSLEEVNLSGDSWVKQTVVESLSKHTNIQIFHLGHLEHSDTSCDKDLKEYPPKGLFIEALFKSTNAFPGLTVLYLESICSLTYWLDVRLKKIRPTLIIKYTEEQSFFKKPGS